jgi:hypothetical protein
LAGVGWRWAGSKREKWLRVGDGGRSYPVDEIPTVVIPLLKTELTFYRGKVGVGSSFESEWRLMLVQNDYQTVNGHWAESKTGWLESWRNNQTCHVCRHCPHQENVHGRSCPVNYVDQYSCHSCHSLVGRYIVPCRQHSSLPPLFSTILFCARTMKHHIVLRKNYEEPHCSEQKL